jgi:hypothetical protein
MESKDEIVGDLVRVWQRNSLRAAQSCEKHFLSDEE